MKEGLTQVLVVWLLLWVLLTSSSFNLFICRTGPAVPPRID